MTTCICCNDGFDEGKPVYRIQIGRTIRHARGGHLVFDILSSSFYMHSACITPVIHNLKYRFQKEPNKCGRCGLDFLDDGKDLIVRTTKGEFVYDKKALHFEEVENTSLIPDLYFCPDCAYEDFGADTEFRNEYELCLDFIIKQSSAIG